MWFECEQPFLSGKRCVTSRKTAAKETSLSPVVSGVVVPNTLRTSWDEDMEVLIKTVFKNKIEPQEVAKEMVKNKFYDHPQLRKDNPNRVLDKVRAQWRFRKSSP